MKWFFTKLLKIVFVLALIITILVVIPLALLHKETTAPYEQYVPESEDAFYRSLDQELVELIDNESIDLVQFTITEAFINRAIQTELSKSNPKFLNESYQNDVAYSYVMVFGNVGIKGLWTSISNDQIIVTAGLDLFNPRGNVFYQSGLEIVFDIVLSENNEYYLRLNRTEIGRMILPTKSTNSLINFITKVMTQKTLNEILAEKMAFGKFDPSDVSFTVGEAELTDYLYSVDPTFAALLKVVYRENLLVLDVSDAGFDVSLNMGTLRRLAGDLEEPSFIPWESELDKAAFMLDLTSRASANIILNPFDPKINLTEAHVNSILDYTLEEKVRFSFPLKFSVDGEEVEYDFHSTNIFIRMNEDVLSIHLRMSLTKVGYSGAFEMQFNLFSHVSMNANGAMVLTIIDANLGEVVLDTDTLQTLFGVFDPTLMIGNQIILPKETLNEMFDGSHLIIDDTEVVDGELVLHFGLDY